MSTHSTTAVWADVNEQIMRRLTAHGQRPTDVRMHLAKVLTDARRPVTLPDIVKLAPELAQSSIYRNLDVLQRCGVVDRITGDGDHAHYELTEPLLRHHHHLICTECGAIEDIHLDDHVEELVEQHLTAAASAAGFSPTSHTLDLSGVCRRCTPTS